MTTDFDLPQVRREFMTKRDVRWKDHPAMTHRISDLIGQLERLDDAMRRGDLEAVDRLKAAAKLKMAELVQCEKDGGDYVHSNHIPVRPADHQ